MANTKHYILFLTIVIMKPSHHIFINITYIDCIVFHIQKCIIQAKHTCSVGICSYLFTRRSWAHMCSLVPDCFFFDVVLGFSTIKEKSNLAKVRITKTEKSLNLPGDLNSPDPWTRQQPCDFWCVVEHTMLHSGLSM